MNIINSRYDLFSPAAAAAARANTSTTNAPAELDAVLGGIVDECVVAFGQGVGMRMTVDADALAFLVGHFRAKFSSALEAFGNRWQQDRDNVSGVAMLLAERAVRHAEGRDSVDIESARKAAADVERHCTLHSRRAARAAGPGTEGAQTRIAGYWCTEGDGKP